MNVRVAPPPSSAMNDKTLSKVLIQTGSLICSAIVKNPFSSGRQERLNEARPMVRLIVDRVIDFASVGVTHQNLERLGEPHQFGIDTQLVA